MLGIFALSFTQVRAKDAPMGVGRSFKTALGEPPRKTGVQRAFSMGPKRGPGLLRPKTSLAGILPWKMLMPV